VSNAFQNEQPLDPNSQQSRKETHFFSAVAPEPDCFDGLAFFSSSLEASTLRSSFFSASFSASFSLASGLKNFHKTLTVLDTKTSHVTALGCSLHGFRSGHTIKQK
jgi:hypothetical protein